MVRCDHAPRQRRAAGARASCQRHHDATEPGLPTSFSARVGSFAVRKVSPIALRPPVGPGIWVADEGCRQSRPSSSACSPSTASWSRRTVSRSTGSGSTATIAHVLATRTLLSNYFSFGQPVIAAADGTVVEARDGLPNSVPPHEPVPPPPLSDLPATTSRCESRPGSSCSTHT